MVTWNLLAWWHQLVFTTNNLEYSGCKVTADDHCKYFLFIYKISSCVHTLIYKKGPSSIISIDSQSKHYHDKSKSTLDICHTVNVKVDHVSCFEAQHPATLPCSPHLVGAYLYKYTALTFKSQVTWNLSSNAVHI